MCQLCDIYNVTTKRWQSPRHSMSQPTSNFFPATYTFLNAKILNQDDPSHCPFLWKQRDLDSEEDRTLT